MKSLIAAIVLFFGMSMSCEAGGVYLQFGPRPYYQQPYYYPQYNHYHHHHYYQPYYGPQYYYVPPYYYNNGIQLYIR